MMFKKSRSIFLAVIILVLVSLACRIGQKSQVELGESFYNEEGGYSLNTVMNYTFTESGGLTEMTAPDALQDAGPTIIVKGGSLDYESSNDALLDLIRWEYESLEIGRVKETTIDGVDGLAGELSGEYLGTEIKGSIFVTMVEPNQEFIMMAFAPESRWKELSPLFTSVLNSVNFFEAGSITAVNDEQEAPTEEVVTEPAVVDVIETEIIRQWAVYAEASTEYTEGDWSAMQATGAPDVDRCGDDSRAWASRYSDTEDFLLLKYESPVIPTELVIYQTYNPSQVVEILFEDLDGDLWVLWEGEPERIDCPDIWTHTIELYESFFTDTVILIIDQSLNDWGWAEIDAVELAGYPIGTEVAQVENQAEPDTPVQPDEEEQTIDEVEQTIDEDIPDNYEGLTAGPVYQGWINIIIGETMEADLDQIMSIEGRESSDSWKPRESHAKTYLYQMPWDGMTGYISVTNEGWVYKISVTSNTHPTDFALTTVNRTNYDELKAIYDRDKVIPYPVMANLLESPGFLREKYVGNDDGKIRTIYNWYNVDGDRITGIFVDGKLTGMMGLNFIEAD